jgi:hypothetical protein
MTEDSAIRVDLHSAQVVHFTHTIRILLVWASSLHSILCHDKHPIRAFHSSTSVRVSTLWSLPLRHAPTVYLSSSSVTLAPWRENPSVFRWLGICCCTVLPHARGQPGFRGSVYQLPRYHKPLYSMRFPALKQTNFRLSPVPYQGNVVARVNCFGGYLVITNVLYKNPPASNSRILIPPYHFENSF